MRVVIGVFMTLLAAGAWGFDHSHRQWQQLLQQTVSDAGASSTVNYTALKADPGRLLGYVQQVQQVTQATFNNWSREQRLAFLINAYNALTLKLVVDHYPVKSIKDIGGFFRNAWKQEFFTLFGQKHHLDYIEHELIRGKNGFAEPRIHFALVCASVGCPKLSNKAYVAQNLEQQLDEAAQVFLRDTSRNRYQAESKRLLLSKIFKWYRTDFESDDDSGKGFIAGYMSDDDALRRRIVQVEDIEYLNYDWRLNDSGTGAP